jgi:hypothetical protein
MSDGTLLMTKVSGDLACITFAWIGVLVLSDPRVGQPRWCIHLWRGAGVQAFGRAGGVADFGQRERASN